MPRRFYESSAPHVYEVPDHYRRDTPDDGAPCPLCTSGIVTPTLTALGLCGRCAFQIYMLMSSALGTRAADNEQEAVKEVEAYLQRPPRPDGWVYYIRRGELIKIGHTVNLKNRMSELVPDEVLAVEPGPMDLEAMRHEQFAEHRHYGEYFRDHADLRRHVAFVVEHYGPPPSGLRTLRPLAG